MSLNMYLGEVQSQTQSMNAMCNATIQGMEQVINSIDAFVFDAILQGQTYDSAKAFFAQTFRPLAQGIIYLCEELIRQNDAFPNDFQSKVASTDVIEQEIEEQMRGIDQTKAGIEVISNTLPGMQAMMGIFDMMKQKLQEKLNHLREFNSTSSSNYDTALQLAASIAKGLAEVQSGKGFSPVSGTFSTQGLNMEWTGPIQKITEDKAREAEKESKKDESLLDKLKDAAEDGIEVAENIFGLYHSYREGKREAVIDELKGLANTILHPIDSIESAMYALSHLDETYDAVKQAISNSWNQDVVNGDWNSRAKWFGNVEAQVQLAAVQLVAGTKGADRVSKLGTFSKSGEVSKIRESVNLIQRVKNVVDSDKYRQFVDRLNNLLMPKDKFALASANVVDSFSDSDVFKQVKEKLSNYQFFKGKDIQEVIQDYADKVLDRVKVEKEYPPSFKESDILRGELKDAGIQPPPYRNAAHHLVPWKDSKAIEAQELLEEFGIHHDSAANGVFLPMVSKEINPYVTTETLHIGSHSAEYADEVARVLKEVKEYGGTQADAIAALHDIRIRLLEGKLDLNKSK